MALDLRSIELEQSFIKERIGNVERHLPDIYSKLSSYNKKLALLRDSGTDFSNSILRFASKENLNQSLRNSLCEFSELFADLQDYREAQIQGIDAKAITQLSNYNSICKKVKEDIKRCFEARSAEFKKQTQLEKIKGKYPNNLPKISQAEKEANLAKEEATQTTVVMSQRVDSFEKKKLEDLKNSLLQFVKIEMMFYAKAIELHTNAYNIIKNIKVDEDLNEFRCHFRALTATLDTECLLNPDSTNNKFEQGENIHSTVISNIDEHDTPVCKLLQSENSSSGLKSLSEPKFDFGEQSL